MATVDLFDTRVMLSVLEQMLPARSFLLDTFFTNTDTSDSKYIDIDLVQGKRRLAPFVNRMAEGKLIERIGHSTRAYKPPYIKPKMVTTAADLLKRGAGDHIYANNKGPTAKAAEQLGKDLAELERIITRREEWMAAKALTTGVIPVVGEGINESLDFNMRTAHKITLSGTALWSDATNSVPIDNLEAWQLLILQNSGLVATDVIMGQAAWQYFRNTSQVLGTSSLFNQRRVDIGEIKPRMQGPGVKYIGHIDLLDIDIWVYNEWFLDPDSGEEGDMMPTNKVLMGSRGARCTRHYGAITDLDATASVPRFPKSWSVPDPSAQFLMVQSAPLPAPHQIDGFVIATVSA